MLYLLDYFANFRIKDDQIYKQLLFLNVEEVLGVGCIYSCIDASVKRI